MSNTESNNTTPGADSFPFESYAADPFSAQTHNQPPSISVQLTEEQIEAIHAAQAKAARAQAKKREAELNAQNSVSNTAGTSNAESVPDSVDEFVNSNSSSREIEQTIGAQIPVENTPLSEDGESSLESIPAAQTVRPVSLGGKTLNTPTSGPITSDDVEALSAYKTLEARRKRKRRKRIIAGAIVGVLALAGIGLWLANNIPTASEEEVPDYDIAFVTRDTFETSVSASGAIKPDSQVVVTPEVDGIIEEVRVAEGDNVLKGDVLLVLKNEALDKAIEEAETAVRTAQNNANSAETAMNNAYNALVQATNSYNTVFSTMFETQEIADAAGEEATSALNAAQEAYDSAVSAYEEAQNAVTKAQEAVDEAKETKEKREVRAPRGGAIVSMTAEVGASVASGTTAAGASSLITIADLSTLRVSVEVNEVDINNLAEGQEAEVTFSALPDVVLSAKVEHIAAVSSGSDEMDFNGGIVTYDVDLVIEDPDPEVRPGMTARVKILSEKIEDALTVPTAALQMLDETNAILLVAPNYTGESDPVFEERNVVVRAQDSAIAVVEGDIEDGDAIQVFYDNGGEDDSAWVD